MLRVLREMESLLETGKSRATRSAEGFSRPHGAAFYVAAQTRNGAIQIPISWNDQPVEFSVAPIIEKVRRRRTLRTAKCATK